jgi:hypothetical protein
MTQTRVLKDIDEQIEKDFVPVCSQGLSQPNKIRSAADVRIYVYCSKPNTDTEQRHNIAEGTKEFFRQGRRALTLKELMQIEMVKLARLRLEEAVVEYQYTGPLFMKWNSLLRKMPFALDFRGNRYATTIHTLVSAVIKTSMITKIPASRKVYRGLSGMVLHDRWLVGDGRSKGGVEYGFLSTTLYQSVAMEYSGVRKNRGVIFEIEVGAIDCGADLSSISQYPEEAELLFGPLAHLEAVGTRIDTQHDKPIVVVCIKINCNLKAPRIEEIIHKRKRLFGEVLDHLHNQVCFDMKLLQGSAQNQSAGEEARALLIKKNEDLRSRHDSWYNNETNFLHALNTGLGNKAATLFEKLTNNDSQSQTKALTEASLIIGARGRTDLIRVFCGVFKSPLSVCNEEGESMLLKACENGHTEFVVQMFLYFKENKRRLVGTIPGILFSGLYILMGLFGIVTVLSVNEEVSEDLIESTCSNSSQDYSFNSNCTYAVIPILARFEYFTISACGFISFLGLIGICAKIPTIWKIRKELGLSDPIGKVVCQSKSGSTPLHVSVNAKNEEIVRLLLNHPRAKGMLRMRDKEGRLPLDLIRDESHETIHSLLLQEGAGASVARSGQGPTTLNPSNRVVPESAQSLPRTTSSARSAAVLA